jgi:hypothetical protein
MILTRTPVLRIVPSEIIRDRFYGDQGKPFGKQRNHEIWGNRRFFGSSKVLPPVNPGEKGMFFEIIMKFPGI